MKSEHTPGPWEAWSEEGPAKGGGFEHSVCRTDVGTVGHALESFHQCVATARGSTVEEARANATLMAAAPDMLALLRRVKESTDQALDVTFAWENDLVRLLKRLGVE